jgi:hypothetical protein
MTDSPDPTLLDLPAFEPVPTTPRDDGWTADRQRRFIAALASLGSVAGACRAVGMSSASAYKLRDRPDAASFAAAWRVGLSMGRDRVMARAFDRAGVAVERPVVRKGVVVGQRRLFDYRLIATILRATHLPNA